MRHLAIIQFEFLKNARQWNDITLEEQKKYLQHHPKSKKKLTAKPQTIDFKDINNKLQIAKSNILSDTTVRKSKSDDSNLKSISTWKNKVSKDVVDAIRSYTIAPSKVNDQLRKVGDKSLLTGTAKVLVDQMNKAFQAQDKFEKPVMTWRGLSFNSEQSQKFIDNIKSLQNENKPFEMSGFTSTSINPAEANGWASDLKTGYVFEIKANHGVYIDDEVSIVSGQKELLLDHGSKFKITGIKTVPMQYKDKIYQRNIVQLEQL